jgi:2-methylcitrate dehydratase PrpD
LLDLAHAHGLKPAHVSEIVLRFPASGAHMIDNNELKSHCAQYILPVGLVFGRVMIDDILQDRLRNPEVARLRKQTRLVADPELDGGWPEAYTSIVEVTTTDGRHLSARVDHAKGNMENPLTRDEIYRKYQGLATTVTSAAHAAQIAGVVDEIETSPDVTRLAGLLRTLKPRASRSRGTREPRARAKGKGRT